MWDLKTISTDISLFDARKAKVNPNGFFLGGGCLRSTAPHFGKHIGHAFKKAAFCFLPGEADWLRGLRRGAESRTLPDTHQKASGFGHGQLNTYKYYSEKCSLWPTTLTHLTFIPTK